jgi:hypothetical protein
MILAPQRAGQVTPHLTSSLGHPLPTGEGKEFNAFPSPWGRGCTAIPMHFIGTRAG